MTIDSGLPLGAGDISKPKPADPEKLKDAARQFESLLISQMMKSARESSSGGWGGENEDKAGDSMMDMAEQQLSQLLAAGGGLGLAKLVIQGISVKTDAPP
jgi:Rod binding domain-containing protein